MRELRLLLYLQRVNALRRNEIRHTRDSRQRRRLIWMLVLYIVLALTGLAYAVGISWGVYAAGLAALLPGMAVTMSAAAALMVTVIRAQGLLFDAQGWERLAALPIRHSTVVWARLLDLYLTALGMSVLIMLPAAVFYALAQGAAALPLWLLLWLLAPLLPLGLGLGIAALLAVAARRFRQRHLLVALLALPLTGWLMLALYTSPLSAAGGDAAMLDMMRSAGGAMSTAYPPANWAALAVQGSPGHLLLLTCVSLGAAALAAAILLRWTPGHTGRQAAAQAHGHAGRPLPPLWALVRKEWRRMLASPLYLMNTGMAVWLAPVMLLLLPLVKPDAAALLRDMPRVMAPLIRFLPLIACFFAGMSVPSAISLSMEGKSAWLMCTAPVSAGTLLGSKALFSFLFCLMPAALGGGLLAWHMQPGWAAALACVLLPVALCALLSVWGLALDLRFARYDWESEQQIVKSSAQTGLGLLSGFVLMALMGLVLWLMPAQWAAQTAWALALLLALAAAWLMRRLSRRRVYQVQ
ncbi:MAG: hypothetical protein GX653_06230 [Clostridiales bacterium]|nr:hypothetical protein [Clostridiales bacterium]